MKFLKVTFALILIFHFERSFADSIADKIEQARENFKNAFTGGDFRKAEEYAKESLQLGKSKYGENSPRLDWDYYFLSHSYFAQGRYSEAEPLVKARLFRSRKVYPKNHPNIAHSLNNLATIYSAQGKYIEAEGLQKEAIKIRKLSFGEEHQFVAASINNLAVLYPTPLILLISDWPI